MLRSDPWLEPFAPAIEGRHEDVLRKMAELTAATGGSLSDFANAYKYFGLQRAGNGEWIFREFAPDATEIFLIGDFNGWHPTADYALKDIGGGTWELHLPAGAIKHGDLYKMLVRWPCGEGERIPAYATRVVQDPHTSFRPRCMLPRSLTHSA